MRTPFVFPGLLLGQLMLSLAVSAQTRPTEDPLQKLLREQRERERETRAKEQPALGGLLQEIDVDRMAPQEIKEDGPVFVIARIRVSGNTLLKPGDIAQTTAPFEGIELGQQRINALLRRLTRRYFEHGYITTRVVLGAQNLTSGELEITVIEGFIERISYSEQGKPARTGLALPFASPDKLSLWDLEQGLEQINRLGRNKAELQIIAGESPGGSVIAISNNPDKAWRVSAGVDNSEPTGSALNRIRATAELENLTGWQEASTFTYSGTRQTNSLLISTSLPIGYSTLNYVAAYSEFQSPVGDFAVLFGDSRAQTLGFSRVMQRGSAAKTTLDFSLSQRISRRFIDDISLTPQRLTVLKLTVSRLRKMANGTVVTEWGWARGVKMLRATTDAEGLPDDATHAQFNKFDALLSWQWQPASSYSARHNLQMQYSKTGLYGAEQLYVGGTASVRGFRDSLVGDQGAYMRNELARRISPSLIGDKTFGEIYLAADFGAAKQVFETTFKRLSGASLGTRVQGRFYSLDLTFSRGLTASQPTRKESLFSASLQFRY